MLAPMAAAINVDSHLVYGIRFCFANWSLVVCSDSGPKEEANVVFVALVTAK